MTTQKPGGDEPFGELMEVFERMEEQVDSLLHQKRLTSSAKQMAAFITWLRAQPPKTLLATAALGMAIFGILVVMTISEAPPKDQPPKEPKPPKSLGKRLRPRNKRWHPKRRKPCPTKRKKSSRSAR